MHIVLKISIPKVWIDEMGINLDEREVEVTFYGKEIRIKKLTKIKKAEHKLHPSARLIIAYVLHKFNMEVSNE